MVFTQTANKTGLPVQAVEKDLWVTAVLQVVTYFLYEIYHLQSRIIV